MHVVDGRWRRFSRIIVTTINPSDMNFGQRISSRCVLLPRQGLTQVKTMIQSSILSQLATVTFADLIGDGQLTRSNGLNHPSSDIHAKADNNERKSRESDTHRCDSGSIGDGVRIGRIVCPSHPLESCPRGQTTVYGSIRCLGDRRWGTSGTQKMGNHWPGEGTFLNLDVLESAKSAHGAAYGPSFQKFLVSP
jgi:hypothetical protein